MFALLDPQGFPVPVMTQGRWVDGTNTTLAECVEANSYWCMCRSGHVRVLGAFRDPKGWGKCGHNPRGSIRPCRWTTQTLPFQKQLWAAYKLGGWAAVVPLINVRKFRRR